MNSIRTDMATQTEEKAATDIKFPFKIITLSGCKSSGKSTSAEYIKSIIPNSVELTYAEPLKEVCASIFRLSHYQLYDENGKKEIDNRWHVSPRKIMQNVGDLFRNYLPGLLSVDNVFIDNMYYRLIELVISDNVPQLVIISDERMEDEHDFSANELHANSIRIIRNSNNPSNINQLQNSSQSQNIIMQQYRTWVTWYNNLNNNLNKNEDNHKSERINFKCDYTITNDGSKDELFDKLNNILKELNILT